MEVIKMKQPIVRDKLSKKAKREWDLKQRRTWERNPVTRCPPNSKAYNRNKARKKVKNPM
jgi:hypothetical protein